MGSPLIWFEFAGAGFEIVVSMFLFLSPHRTPLTAPFTRQSRLSQAVALLLLGCVGLLLAAMQTWPEAWHNQVWAVIALALSVIALFLALIGLVPLMKRVLSQLDSLS